MICNLPTLLSGTGFWDQVPTAVEAVSEAASFLTGITLTRQQLTSMGTSRDVFKRPQKFIKSREGKELTLGLKYA